MERIITTAQAIDAGLVDETDLGGGEQIALHLGANEASSRHLDGIGPSFVLYLRTATGTRGTGAHAGFVVELDEETAVTLGFDRDAILLSAGAHRCEVRLDGEPCCRDCYAAAGGKARGLPRGAKGRRAICPSCATMIRESWEERAQARDARDAA